LKKGTQKLLEKGYTSA